MILNWRNGVFVILLLLQSGCSLFGIRTAETPKFQLLEVDGRTEIRSYGSYVVATTVVPTTERDHQRTAFMRLAGYIFGDNEKKQKIAMTAPVIEAQKGPEKLSMTAPVLQSSSGGNYKMSFSMPAKYNLEDLPTPKDERIKFEQVPPKMLAVLSYTGAASNEKRQNKADELKEWLAKSRKFKSIGEPVFAGYDPPWTISFLRRNEVMIEVEKAP